MGRSRWPRPRLPFRAVGLGFGDVLNPGSNHDRACVAELSCHARWGPAPKRSAVHDSLFRPECMYTLTLRSLSSRAGIGRLVSL